ncbi:MAG: MFS transporter [Cyclobacteriaceae bacterium]|nr:MFS transporter [Cyclobacteriaceae bacterium]
MENINKNRLFVASCLALLVTSMTFAIRAKIEHVFNVEYGLSKVEVGWAFGPAFWGFTIAMFVGGLIIDLVKTRSVVWSAFILHFVGIIVLIIAKDKTTLFMANVFIGLGNGAVEAACNPLVATIYPNNKTQMLNKFHVWFPGGIVIGGLLSYFLIDQMGLGWQVLVGLLFLPLAIYGYLFFGQTIPETERVSSGVSYKDMLKNVGAPYTIILTVLMMIIIASMGGVNVNFSSPVTWGILALIIVMVFVEGRVINKITLLFPFILLCMFLTASTELGTNQWINALLENKGINPMIILVVITGIMAVGRYFAGPLVHRLNPTGVLLASSVLSAIGLYWMSISVGPVITMMAAIVFALGICYFWPTMLGFVAEYIPKSGALGLSIMGGAGMVATSMVLPIMGGWLETAGENQALSYMAIIPVVLVVLFIPLYFYMKGKTSGSSSAH